MKIFCFLILVMNLASPVHACETPEKAIAAYLQYDFDGERLGSDVSVHIDKLTANQYEPAWDVMTLVTGYQIRSIKQNNDNAVVTVVFNKAWEIARKFKAESIKDEFVNILLIKIKGCWKVGPPFYQPHVSSNTALKHLEKLIEDGRKSKMDNKFIEYTQSELESARQYTNSIKLQ